LSESSEGFWDSTEERLLEDEMLLVSPCFLAFFRFVDPGTEALVLLLKMFPEALLI
jgi:hypothetical protein